MKIEVLYFEGCPNHKPTVERDKQVINQFGVAAEVRQVELTQDDDPAALRFIGSPTVLIDGRDIDLSQRAGASYGFGCRTFGGAGVPPVEMIEQAVREASDHGDGDHDGCPPQTASEPAESKPDQSNRLSFWSTPAAVGSAIFSSACCWLPLLLLAFGLSAGGVVGFFESVRPYFLAAAVVFLGAGFYLAYLRKRACKPGEACAVPNRKGQRFNHGMLWVAAAFVIVFALFPYYSPALVRTFADTPASIGTDTAAIGTTRVFHIEGMTCTACAAGLEVRLSKLTGVAEAKVSYAGETATITSPPQQPSAEDIRMVIEQAGFSTTAPAPE